MNLRDDVAGSVHGRQNEAGGNGVDFAVLLIAPGHLGERGFRLTEDLADIRQQSLFLVSIQVKSVQADQIRAFARQNFRVQGADGIADGDAVLPGHANFQLHHHLRMGHLVLGDHLWQVFAFIQAVDGQLGIRHGGDFRIIGVVQQHGSFIAPVAQHIEGVILRTGQGNRQKSGVSQGGPGAVDQFLHYAAPGHKAI